MKIMLVQLLKYNGEYVGPANKIFESDVIPCAGMYIADPIWSDESEVLKVIINYNSNWCTVCLDDCDIESSDDIEEIAENFRSNGWTVHL